jgi:hypothetical protein
MTRFFVGIAALCVAGCMLASSSWSQEEIESNWPQQIDIPQGSVVIYQPQPEKLEGNLLDARAAVSVEVAGAEGPVFGAVWFRARLDTDRDERTATIADVSVTRVRFPSQDEAKAQQLSDLLEREIPKWEMSISIDRLVATLELAEART